MRERTAGLAVNLEHLWAGWRREYIVDATARERAGGISHDQADCVFCRLAANGAPSEDNLVVWRGELTFVVMDAYPYASGHVLVLPLRHVGALAVLTADESTELWSATQAAVAAASHRSSGKPSAGRSCSRRRGRKRRSSKGELPGSAFIFPTGPNSKVYMTRRSPKDCAALADS